MTPTLTVQVHQDPAARDLPLPEYATAGAAGMDLRAAVPADAPLALEPGKRALVPTGLRIALPPGCEAQVRPRSGLALKHGIGVLNSPGTIDEDYRGEVGVILINFGDETFTIRRGDRIAQLVFHETRQLTWHRVDSLDELSGSRRGGGGFGHTGRE